MPQLHNATHDLIEFLPDATFAIDKDGVVIAWNHAIELMTGISSEEMIGEGRYAYAVPFHGEHRPILIDFFASKDSDLTSRYDHVTVTDAFIEGETTSVHLKGEASILRGRAAPLFDEEGRYTGAIEVIRDITEEIAGRKRLRRNEELASFNEELRTQLDELTAMQKELMESEEKYRLLVENQQDLVVKTDPTGRFLYANPAYCQLFDTTEEEILGTRFIPLIHPEERRVVEAAVRRLFEPPYETSYEEKVETQNGWRWIAWTAKACSDDDGEIISLIGTGRDITRQKRVEDALLLKDAAIESSINGIAIADLSGIITYANPAFLALWGFEDRREVTGRHLVSFWRSEEAAAGVIDAIRRHSSYTGEMEAVRKDGTTLSIRLSAGIVHDAADTPVAMMGSFIDITEEKSTLRELETNQKRLEGAMEIGQLAWWEMDCQTGSVIFSPRKAEMLGYSPDQFSHYTNFTALLHPDDHEKAMQAMRDHLEGIDERYEVEYRIRAAGGEYLWFRDVGGISERDTDGTPLNVVGLVANITRRKRDEALIRETGEQYRTLFDEAQNPILVADMDGRYIDGNQAALSFLECSRDELRTKHIWDYVPPDDLERVREEHNPLVGRRTVETTYLVNGSLKTLLLNVVPLEKGEETLLYGIGQDITERKQAEIALQESEERFRTLFMDSPVSIIIHDQDSGMIIDANSKACAMYGLSSVEELTKEDLWMEPPYSFEDARAWIRKAASGGPQEFEWLSRAVTGDLYWENVRLIPVVISGVQRILAASIDITDRKLAEEELRKSEALLRTAGRVARFGGWEVSLDENRMTWSDEVARIHGMEAGYSPSVEGGISFYAPEWREKIREVFSGCVRFGTPYDEEMEIITATGERRWVRTTGEAVRDTNGTITGVQGAFQDITERKKVEESWKRAYSQIEENMYKFSILNDEIRNPLAVIMALADLEGGEYAGKIMEQIRAIDRIITLLDKGVLESESIRAFMRKHDHPSG